MDTNSISVSVEHLEKKFGTFTAVNKISFEVHKGQIFGFLGPNGSGKSTTIRMLCGILAPTSGKGTVGGYDIYRQQELIKQNIGYMSQKFSLYADLTVEENIDFYSGIYKVPTQKRRERKEWVIQMAGVGPFRNMLTETLAAGWKQRLALGCAIIHEPGIVFLDEPTSGVDPIARNNFWKLIKDMSSRGVTVFVTTHYMDEAENCDMLALIYEGNIIASGKPSDLKTTCMKGQVLRIDIAHPEQWMEGVSRIKLVQETALFGSSIHAVVKDAVLAKQEIGMFLKDQGVHSYSVEQIQPNLEDVFVSLIESYQGAARERK